MRLVSTLMADDLNDVANCVGIQANEQASPKPFEKSVRLTWYFELFGVSKLLERSILFLKNENLFD